MHDEVHKRYGVIYERIEGYRFLQTNYIREDLKQAIGTDLYQQWYKSIVK